MVSKSQLASRIAARGASPAQAGHAVDEVLGEITAALAAGERVTLVGFGTFEAVARPARTARNPRTGETVPVVAGTVPRFHAGASLKAAVADGGVTLGAAGALADKPAKAASHAGLVAVVAPVKVAKAGKPAKASKADADAKGKDGKVKGKDAKGKKSGKKK